MSIQPATITRDAALASARSLIGKPYVSSPVRTECFNGWTFLTRCLGGEAPAYASGYGPRERWLAMGFFFGRGLKLTTIEKARPGDVLVFSMGRDGFHGAILSEVGGPEPKMIHTDWGRACVESWVGKRWTDRLVAVFTPADAAGSAANDDAMIGRAA